MEGVNESFVHSPTNVPKAVSSAAIAGSQQGASKSTESPRNISTPMTTPVILKQPLLSGTVAGATYVKPANHPPIVSLLPVASTGTKVENCVNGSQVREHGGNATYFCIPISMLYLDCPLRPLVLNVYLVSRSRALAFWEYDSFLKQI